MIKQYVLYVVVAKPYPLPNHTQGMIWYTTFLTKSYLGYDLTGEMVGLLQRNSYLSMVKARTIWSYGQYGQYGQYGSRGTVIVAFSICDRGNVL